VLVGQPQAEARLRAGAFAAIQRRVAALGAQLVDDRYVAPEPQAIGQALQTQRDAGAELLILAGETSIVDRDDVIPQGIVAAGGQIVHYGAPVEPGNLLLLAELPPHDLSTAPLAVIGAPGCVRSRDTNVVDLLLPRLLARQRLTKADIVALGHGGLLL
jgi:molybdenum cofactor cytidylyltransferase